MKRYARLIAVLLCAVTVFALASCANTTEEVPSGMQIASCNNADYRLYVPTSWVLNTSYGVSGAYRSLDQQSTVSVVSYDVGDYAEQMQAAGVNMEESGARIKWFWDTQCYAPVQSKAFNKTLTLVEEECVATSLDGANAKQYRYHGSIQQDVWTELHFLQVVAEREARFYVFTFTATEEMFGMYRSEVDQMLEYFIFAEPYELFEAAKHLDNGKDAPAGMKSAFGDDVAYCFYVPNGWEIRYDESIYAAYDPTDKTSVSVTPYMPDAISMSVSQYFEMSRRMMENMVGEGEFTLLSDTEKVDLGGREATVYEYRLRVGGVDYHYRQYIAAYKSMIYCLTYTATEDRFNAHLEELDSIVAAFQFR